MRLRVTLSLLVTAALMVGSVAESAPAVGDDSSLAQSAKKKKCKKKKKGKGAVAAKKCKRKKRPATPPATPTPAPPNLSINPTSHNFGTLFFMSTASKVFTVTNGGGSASGALASSIPATAQSSSFSISEDTCAGIALAAATSCTLKVTFTAPLGSRSATLNVSGVPGGDLSASLSGAGSI